MSACVGSFVRDINEVTLLIGHLQCGSMSIERRDNW